MLNESDFIDLGLSCANVCRALDRGLNGKRLDELNRSVWEAIEQLTGLVPPSIYTLFVFSLHRSWLQGFGRNAGKGHSKRSTGYALQAGPREERQRGDRRLEDGPD
jgi:hypothetical protein